jgi:hypothetical protein
MEKKLSIEDFNIDISTIPQDVKDLYNSFSKIRKSMLGKYYASGYDFIIIILYYLIFVEKLEKSEIAQKLGLRVVNVHEHLYDFAWNYSNDYAENKIISEKELVKLQEDLAEAKENSRLLDENEHIKLKEAIEKVKNIQEKSYLELGFKTREEYARTIYYLIFFKYFSPKNLVRLFNITISVAHLRLKTLGLNLSHVEAIKIKKEQGTQNYSVSLSRGKITRAKSQLKNFSTGSKNEDYFRKQLSNMIYQYLDSGKHEVVVGLSNTGILGSLEIDIPIMVYDVVKNQVHRFAIEYSGNYFHTDEQDMSKKTLAESKGWHYLDVIENSDNQYSNNPGLLDPIIRGTCEKIKKIILESN